MSAVSEPQNPAWVEPDQYIQLQLDQARSRIRTTDVLTATVLAGLLLVGYVLIFTLLDHWVIPGGFRPLTRAILLFLILSACSAIILWYVIRRLGQSVHPVFAARMLERSQQHEDGSLLTLIDLQAHGRDPGVSIRRTLEKRAAVRLAGVHIDEVIDRGWLMRLSLILFVMTLLTCLYAVLSPKSISLLRPFSFARAAVSTRTLLESIQPGNAAVPAGTQVEFQVDVAGHIPDSLQVLYTTADRRFVDEPLTMQPGEDAQRFTVLLTGEAGRGIRQNLQYRIVAGDAISDTYNITVIQPPTAHVTLVQYQHPEYMQLPDRSEQAGAIATWQDTTVTITAESSAPVTSAMLQFSDDAAFSSQAEEASMSVIGTTLTAKWKLEERADKSFPGFYRISVQDSEGRSDPEPPVYPIQVRRDAPPIVRVLDPARDLDVPANAVIPILAEAEDPDFLLRNVTLHYAVNGQARQPAEFLMDSASTGFVKSWRGSYELNLSRLRVKPGDLVTWHLEARDNRPSLGNQGSSGELNLRITAPVSDQQVQEQLQQDRQMQQQQLQQNQAQEQSKQGQPQAEQPTAEPQPQQQGQEQQTDQQDMPAANTATGQASKQPETTEPGQPENGNQSPDNQPDPRNTQQKQGGTGAPESATPDADSQDRQQNPSENQSEPVKSRRADEDEALKKLIESMQRKPGSAEDEQPSDAEQSEITGQSGSDQNSQSDQQSEQTAGQTSDSDNKTQQNTETENRANEDSDLNKTDANKTNGNKTDSNKTDSNKSDSNKSDSNKSDSNKSDSNKTDSNKTDSNKTDGNKSDGNKSDSNKSDSNKTDSNKTDSNKTDSNKTDGNKSDGNKSDGNKADGNKSDGNKSDGNKTDGNKSDGGQSGIGDSESNPSGDNQKGSDQSGTNKSGKAESEAGGKSGGAADGVSNPSAAAGKGNSRSSQGNSGDSGKPDSESENSGGTPEQSPSEKSPGDQSTGDKSGGDEQGKAAGKQGAAKKTETGKAQGSDEQSGGPESGSQSGGGQQSQVGKPTDQSPGESQDTAEQADAEGGNAGKQPSQGSKSGSQPSDSQQAGGGKAAGKSGNKSNGGGQQPGGGGQGPTGQPGATGGVHSGGGGQSEADESGPRKSGPEGTRGTESGPGPDPNRPANAGGAVDSPSAVADRQRPDHKAEVEEAAAAAGLALKRLQKELERGEVDPQLLKELGWTEEELSGFAERMQQQLNERVVNDQQQREKSLAQKSFEEMLRSLGIGGSGASREGDTRRDRDRQDTTIRNSPPPSRYRSSFEAYQRSLSTGRSGNPKPAAGKPQ